MLLLDGYLPTLALTLGYLLVVWMGPRYMKHRQAYSCRGAMMLYNLGITILSFGMFSEVKGPGVNKKWPFKGIYSSSFGSFGLKGVWILCRINGREISGCNVTTLTGLTYFISDCDEVSLSALTSALVNRLGNPPNPGSR